MSDSLLAYVKWRYQECEDAKETKLVQGIELKVQSAIKQIKSYKERGFAGQAEYVVRLDKVLEILGGK